MGERVAVIGLGVMGEPMARNLATAGLLAAVFDVDAARTSVLAGLGARAAASPADAVRAATCVLLSLPGREVVDAVLFGDDGVAHSAAANTLVIDTSTNYPPASVEAARRLAEHGIEFIDAPVSGGRAGAEQATLSIMVGGPDATVARARPVLEAIGQRITHLGPQVGAGGYGKLANQIFVSIHFAAIAEGLVFAAKAGLDIEQLVGALQAGWAQSTVLGVKAPQILARAFDQPVGTVAVQAKDLRYITESMVDLGIELPLSPLLLGWYEQLLAEGKAGLDQIAIIELLERVAGVTVGGNGGRGGVERP